MSKFLSVEDAARQLGIGVDDLNRLVDKKKVFPMRDGGTMKFKADDVERLARDLAEASEDDDGLVLDLSGPASGGISGAESVLGSDQRANSDVVLGSGLKLGSDLGLGSGGGAGGKPPSGRSSDLALGPPVGEEPESIFTPGPAVPHSGSRTIVSSKFDGRGNAGGDDLSLLIDSGPLPSGTGGEDDLIVAGESRAGSFDDDLALESIIGSSSPSLPGGPSNRQSPAEMTGADAGMTMAIDLDKGEDFGDLIAADEQPADPGAQSAIDGGGSKLDSGLDLDGDLMGSGAGLTNATRAGLSGSLAGDAFDLGADDESGSVVIGVEESGESSVFTNEDASGSVVFGAADADAALAEGSILMGPAEVTIETPFNVWQVVGLACCAALMLMAALVMLDLGWKIRSPHGTPISTPLLQALSETFGWQQ